MAGSTTIDLSMTFVSLRALHASIGSALDDLERTYAERGQARGQSLDYPHLDHPYYATAPHSADEELAETLNDDPAVSLTSKKIVAACGQLSAAVNKPWYGLVDSAASCFVTAAMRFLEAAHVVEILKEAGPPGMHVGDIHRHILRLLATSHWLREVAPDVFANNRRSSYIDSGKTLAQLRSEPSKKYVDTDGVAAYVGVTGDECHKFSVYLTEWLLPDTHVGSLVVDAKSGPDGTQANGINTRKADSNAVQLPAAHQVAFDTPLLFFPWLELPENSFRLERLSHAMTGTRQWETKEAFPWAELPPHSVLVDVGGGIGSTSLTVAQAHPHIKVVVEDRPQLVASAPSSWGPQLAPIFDSGRMTFRARDLFAPWAPLQSGSAPNVFLLRLVLHAWEDDDCRSILRQLRAGAGAGTKLLIGDILLPYACGGQDAFVRDDVPVLANLGVANVHGYQLDVMVCQAR
ncbi:S-adenosyl-L-methionine-dependent methyltransferase [Trametes elegans]|nr:S-adenosyl-L-methionine-dependent methyltransferase [Trametes elegans]